MKRQNWMTWGIAFLSTSVIDTWAQSAGEGGGSDIGNGGGAWVCRRGSHREWIELVDHFEARQEHGDAHVPVLTGANYQSIVDQFAEKIRGIDADFFARFTQKLALVRARWNELPEGDVIEINDGAWTYMPRPETCPRGHVEYQQIANFLDRPGDADDQVKIDQLWFSRLSMFDRALLQVHEAIYALKREPPELGGESARDSSNARRLVGYLASDVSVEEYRHLLRASMPAPEAGRLTPGDYQMISDFRTDRMFHAVISETATAGVYRFRPYLQLIPEYVGRYSPRIDEYSHIIATCVNTPAGSSCRITYDGSLRYGGGLIGEIQTDPINPSEVGVEGHTDYVPGSENATTPDARSSRYLRSFFRAAGGNRFFLRRL